MTQITTARRTGAPLIQSMIAVTALFLTGCQHPGAEPIGPSTRSVTLISGETSAFAVPNAQDTQTPGGDLLMLVEALDEAYRALDFAPPFPRIGIVAAHSRALKDDARVYAGSRAQARAVISADGEEIIYFSRSELRDGSRLKALALHELSHLQA